MSVKAKIASKARDSGCFSCLKHWIDYLVDRRVSVGLTSAVTMNRPSLREHADVKPASIWMPASVLSSTWSDTDLGRCLELKNILPMRLSPIVNLQISPSAQSMHILPPYFVRTRWAGVHFHCRNRLQQQIDGLVFTGCAVSHNDPLCKSGRDGAQM